MKVAFEEHFENPNQQLQDQICNQKLQESLFQFNENGVNSQKQQYQIEDNNLNGNLFSDFIFCDSFQKEIQGNKNQKQVKNEGDFLKQVKNIKDIDIFDQLKSIDKQQEYQQIQKNQNQKKNKDDSCNNSSISNSDKINSEKDKQDQKNCGKKCKDGKICENKECKKRGRKKLEQDPELHKIKKLQYRAERAQAHRNRQKNLEDNMKQEIDDFCQNLQELAEQNEFFQVTDVNQNQLAQQEQLILQLEKEIDIKQTDYNDLVQNTKIQELFKNKIQYCFLLQENFKQNYLKPVEKRVYKKHFTCKNERDEQEYKSKIQQINRESAKKSRQVKKERISELKKIFCYLQDFSKQIIQFFPEYFTVFNLPDIDALQNSCKFSAKNKKQEKQSELNKQASIFMSEMVRELNSQADDSSTNINSIATNNITSSQNLSNQLQCTCKPEKKQAFLSNLQQKPQIILQLGQQQASRKNSQENKKMENQQQNEYEQQKQKYQYINTHENNTDQNYQLKQEDFNIKKNAMKLQESGNLDFNYENHNYDQQQNHKSIFFQDHNLNQDHNNINNTSSFNYYQNNINHDINMNENHHIFHQDQSHLLFDEKVNRKNSLNSQGEQNFFLHDNDCALHQNIFIDLDNSGCVHNQILSEEKFIDHTYDHNNNNANINVNNNEQQFNFHQELNFDQHLVDNKKQQNSSFDNQYDQQNSFNKEINNNTNFNNQNNQQIENHNNNTLYQTDQQQNNCDNDNIVINLENNGNFFTKGATLFTFCMIALICVICNFQHLGQVNNQLFNYSHVNLHDEQGQSDFHLENKNIKNENQVSNHYNQEELTKQKIDQLRHKIETLKCNDFVNAPNPFTDEHEQCYETCIEYSQILKDVGEIQVYLTYSKLAQFYQQQGQYEEHSHDKNDDILLVLAQSLVENYQIALENVQSALLQELENRNNSECLKLKSHILLNLMSNNQMEIGEEIIMIMKQVQKFEFEYLCPHSILVQQSFKILGEAQLIIQNLNNKEQDQQLIKKKENVSLLQEQIGIILDQYELFIDHNIVGDYQNSPFQASLFHDYVQNYIDNKPQNIGNSIYKLRMLESSGVTCIC
ncbi:hypothetical protein PPERSA_01351 [Pseudocohnilembus persalinus]|uniref:BZIP domain-containing protein n=1 Tax=Pseudocohnilembus persalinus TaxID=266149 RepID=A0A0V0QH23_PSEPJ|nr:hypothetical protein PPERSA_01351 [Pseudocohnilembus persalinus]|eukprot:KRX01448.1 hypothetical protein PPERSA_01351 [Pseudocohnilembus persalinus]